MFIFRLDNHTFIRDRP